MRSSVISKTSVRVYEGDISTSDSSTLVAFGSFARGLCKSAAEAEWSAFDRAIAAWIERGEVIAPLARF